MPLPWSSSIKVSSASTNSWQACSGGHTSSKRFGKTENHPLPLGEGRVRVQDLTRLATLTRRFAPPSPKGRGAASSTDFPDFSGQGRNRTTFDLFPGELFRLKLALEDGH